MARTRLDVHLARGFGEPLVEALRGALVPEVNLTVGADATNGDYDVLVAGRATREELGRARVFVVPFAGVSGPVLALAREVPELRIYNVHHNAEVTAEHAVALLLAASRRIVPADAALRRGDWGPRFDEDGGLLLHGRTALVVGYGAIGQAVARRLRAFGMKVRATCRRPVRHTPEHGTVPRPAGALLDELAASDVVVVTVPLTDETRGLFDAGAFDAMRTGAVFVNVSRGEVVDETALYEALRSGHLHSAAIDVWYSYPGAKDDAHAHRPAELPFEALDNLVMSPHREGNSVDTEQLRAEHLAAVLNDLAAGREPRTRVDLAAGY